MAQGKGGKGAKAATLPAPAQQPLAPIQANAGKSIEEMYQKKTQLEHIILRPDTYIGSTERQPFCIWVHNGQKMEYKSVSYPPGLYKIFDEILVNAADNKVRDATMDTIKVDVDTVSCGCGLAAELPHPEEGLHPTTPAPEGSSVSHMIRQPRSGPLQALCPSLRCNYTPYIGARYAPYQWEYVPVAVCRLEC